MANRDENPGFFVPSPAPVRGQGSDSRPLELYPRSEEILPDCILEGQSPRGYVYGPSLPSTPSSPFCSMGGSSPQELSIGLSPYAAFEAAAGESPKQDRFTYGWPISEHWTVSGSARPLFGPFGAEIGAAVGYDNSQNGFSGNAEMLFNTNDPSNLGFRGGLYYRFFQSGFRVGVEAAGGTGHNNPDMGKIDSFEIKFSLPFGQHGEVRPNDQGQSEASRLASSGSGTPSPHESSGNISYAKVDALLTGLMGNQPEAFAQARNMPAGQTLREEAVATVDRQEQEEARARAAQQAETPADPSHGARVRMA